MKKSCMIFILTVVFVCLCGFSENNPKMGEIKKDNGSSIIIVGDSRTVTGYQDTLDPRVSWLATSGTDYFYFVDNYVPMISAENLSGKKIVILYGINDLTRYGAIKASQNWIDFYNTTAQQWIIRGATVIVGQVPPVDKKLLDYIPEANIDATNAEVANYNALIISSLPSNIKFIPIAYSTKKPLKDGIHYSTEEDIVLYNDLISRVMLNCY